MTPVPTEKKEVPIFSAYADEFMKTYSVANNKPSEQAPKARMLTNQRSCQLSARYGSARSRRHLGRIYRGHAGVTAVTA
jgi:hypothetical protein